jgi:hypothetical protein
MADVFGSIGNEAVELNNAATEATLRLLLQATLATNKGQKDAVKDMVTKAGLDPAAVAAANTNLKTVGATANVSTGVFKNINTSGEGVSAGFKKLDASLSPLIGQLIDGKAQASDVFTALSRLPGPLGVFADGLSRVARYQEENMKTYQTITASGVSLGGSLTQLRQSALNTYMTLDQFSNLMKTNSEVLARMGGTANDGAKAFIGLSNSLLSGEIGNKMLALGYTTDQVNQGMLSYIESTGGRNKKELQNTDGILKGTQNYLNTLDELAQITGKTRDEQQAAAKEAAQNQAYQSYLMTLTEEERGKAERARADALARGGKGAEQAMMSAALGFPPMTKAAQQYTTIAGNMNQVTMKQVAAIKDSSKTLEDQKRIGTEYNAAAIRDKERLGKTGEAMIMAGGEVSGTVGMLTGTANRAIQQGAATDAEARAQQEKIDEERRKREQSQAAEMGKVDKAMKEMGQAFNDMLAPAINYMTKILVALTTGISKVVTAFSEANIAVKLLIAGIAALALWKTRELAMEKAKAVSDKVKEAGSTAASLRRGYSPSMPLYVQIVKGLPIPDNKDKTGPKDSNKPTSPSDGKTDKPGSKDTGKPTDDSGKKLGKMGRVTGGVGGLVGGFALDYLGEKAKADGNEKTAAGLDVGSAALTGAGIGAFLGPLGAAIGGLAGGVYGAYKNWDTLTGKEAADTKKKSDARPMADGGIVSSPTNALIGEAGPEIVSPIQYFNNLQTELETLNKQTTDMIRYLKETAEYSRRNVDATKSLSGDLFKF